MRPCIFLLPATGGVLRRSPAVGEMVQCLGAGVEVPVVLGRVKRGIDDGLVYRVHGAWELGTSGLEHVPPFSNYLKTH